MSVVNDLERLFPRGPGYYHRSSAWYQNRDQVAAEMLSNKGNSEYSCIYISLLYTHVNNITVYLYCRKMKENSNFAHILIIIKLFTKFWVVDPVKLDKK